MAKSNSAQAGWLALLFQASGYSKVADNAGTTPLTNLYISLHTADPGAGGDQTTHEAAYGGYARVAVVRSSVGWTISGTSPTQVTNAGLVSFPKATSGSETETYFAVGEQTSGAGRIFYSAALGSSLTVGQYVQPQFAAGTLVITES